MSEGEQAAGVLDALVKWASDYHCSGEGVRPDMPEFGEADGLASRVARHARSVVDAGGAPAEAIDSCLVMLLHSGESAALRDAPAEDPDLDPAGVRPLARRFARYQDAILAGAPVRPPSLRNRSYNLQIMTTRRCQLRCGYCPVVKGERDTPADVMIAAADLLLTTEQDRVRLDFTGGEPLLRFDDVVATARHLAEGAERAGKTHSFYMVTNGFLMDRQKAATLRDLGFRVELSLDGEETLHNRYKIPVDHGENPYSRTVRALATANEAGLTNTVVMVVTPDTVEQMQESFAHAVERGARSIDINYAVGKNWAPEALHLYLKGLLSIIHARESDIRAGRLEIGNLASRVEPAILNAEWMVDTDGSVHLMTEWALESSRPSGSRDLSVGTLGTLGNWDSLYAGRFHAYLSLLETYSWNDGKMRRLLHNNVMTGRAVARKLAEIS